jgi:hypothetical protein
MRVEFLQPEPDLEFGNGGKCQDIKFGIGHYGTFDFSNPDGPRRIKLGMVGTDESLGSLAEWLTRCQDEIPAKHSNQPRLYPPFPGFAPKHGFHSRLTWNANDFRRIQVPADISALSDFNKVVEKVVELYVEEIAQVIEKSDVDVIICAPPLEHLQLTTYLFSADEAQESASPQEQVEPDADSDSSPTMFDFHDLLKAKSLVFRIPLQIVLPGTYDKTKQTSQKKIFNRNQQDEATRAWNLHTALYYKARGIPWRITRGASDVSTCYLGVSFFRTLDQERLYAGSAQVFNERGEGVVVRGGLAYEDKDDRQIHLDKAGAYNLIATALEAFKSEHFHYPARVVIHKTSEFSKDESDGCKQYLNEKGISLVDLMYVRDSATRLFRSKNYPPPRGTLWYLEDRRAALYTRGSIYFYETYPGSYPPRSLFLDCTEAQKSVKDLAWECLALSKMNWNNTRFDGLLPITLRAAKQVGKILKYLEGESTRKISPAYRFYM